MGPLLPKLIIAATTEAEMRYAAGLSVPDPFILLDTGRKRTLLLSSLEYGRVKRRLTKRAEAVLLDPYYERIKKGLVKRRRGREIRKGSALALIAAAYLKERGIAKVVMPARSYALHVEQLRHAGIGVTVSSAPLSDRTVKTSEEVRAILGVRNATETAMRRCIRILRDASIGERRELIHDGKRVTSELLRREARRILLDHGCEASELIISHGAQTAYPHEHGRGRIRKGEPVILDFFPRSMASGYWFDMTRTVMRGRPSTAYAKLWAAVREAQEAALKSVKAGVTTGTVHKAAAEVLRRRGYATTSEEGYLHSTGHGLGLEIHEAPSLHDGGTERLRAGMIITVEPGLYYRRLGGARLEDTVLVTRTGCTNLTRMRKRLRP